MKTKMCGLFLFFTVLSAGISQVSQYSEQFITMPEIWQIDGEDFIIRGTVITGGSLFTIHAILDHLPEQDQYNKDIAEKIARYAFEHGYLENSMKYSPYSESVYIRDDMLAVALIKVIDEKHGKIAGAKFAFVLDELYEQPITIPPFPLPGSFPESEQQSLKNRIKEICTSRYFDDLFTLYCDDALDDFNVEEEKTKRRVEYSLSKEFLFEEGGFTVYTGTKDGRRGFHYNIPVKIRPVSDENLLLPAFFNILLIDDISEYNIYSISINFVNPNDLHIYLGQGKKIEFEVNAGRE